MQDRNLITVNLWPAGSLFQGKRADTFVENHPELFTKIEAEPAHIELLIAEYKRMYGIYKQEAARSLECALREWREEIIAEDDPPPPPKITYIYAQHTTQPAVICHAYDPESESDDLIGLTADQALLWAKVKVTGSNTLFTRSAGVAVLEHLSLDIPKLNT